MASSEAPLIAVIDYDMGTRRSVEKALNAVDAQAVITRDPEIIRQAAGVVIPGQGAFPAAMENLKTFALLDELERARQTGVAILGICLGMQIMLDSSSEHRSADNLTPGMGWISGSVNELQIPKLPNIGWAEVEWAKGADLASSEGKIEPFYHLHSYVCEPTDESVISARTLFQRPFVSGVQQDNLYGVQFHPEKSGVDAGLPMLRNFVELAAEAQQ